MSPAIFILIAGVVLFAIAIEIQFPLAFVILAIPASFLVLHVGASGGGNNLSLADGFLLLATVCSLPAVPWKRAAHLRKWFIFVSIYMAATLLSVAANPNRFDAVEWLHQGLMLVGGALVGYAIGFRNRGNIAMALYVAVGVSVSAWATALWLAHGLSPVPSLPGGLQKNTVGDLLVVAVLICQFGFPTRHRIITIAKYGSVVGILAVASRQAIAGLIVAVIVTFLRNWRTQRRNPDPSAKQQRHLVIVIGLFLLSAIAYFSVTHELSSGNKFNSIATREASYSQTLDIWRSSPILGVGERYWYTGLYPGSYQPPNAEVAMLATGGLVGLIGLATLLFGSLRIAWRLPPALGGSLALSVLVAHIVEGQFDIFWVTATGTLPWIFLGLSLGKTHASEHRGAQDPYQTVNAKPSNRR